MNSNMNLEVRAHLRDDLARPTEKMTAALDKFGASADRLTKRARQLTSGLRGLAGAFRDFHAVNGAADSATATTGRLRGMLSDVGKVAKTAVPGVADFSRATSRLATNAGKAADNVGRLRSAMSAPLANSVVARTNAELRETLDLQRRVRTGMRSLGDGRRGMGGSHGERMPGVALALHPHGSGAIRSVYEQATTLQDAIVKMHLNGLSDADIASVRAKADEVAKLNRSTTPLSNINAIMEARLALGGDLKEALATAAEMSKLRTIVGFSLGKDRAKSAEDGVYDMLRTGEIRGLIGDPARRGRLFQGMTAALIASNGRITPKQWHQTAVQGRSATQGLSDDFTNGRLPFLMQELQGGGRGGPAGVALQSLFRAIPLAITKQTNIREWRRLGFIDESKVLKGRHGGEKPLPGAITLGRLAASDPDKAVFKLLDAIKAHGTTDRGAIIQKFAQLIGTGTGQTAVDILALQRDRLDNFTRTLKQVEDSDALFGQIQSTASQSVENLDVSMKTLSGNIGSIVIPAFSSLVDAANSLVRTVNGVAETGGGNGNDPIANKGGGLSLMQGGLLGGGAVFGLGKLAARFPLFGRMMAGAAGSVVTGSPFGAALEPAITSGAKLLASKVPEAIKTGLVAGVGRGLLIGVAYEAGKALIDSALARVLSKPKLEPAKQAAFDAHMDRWNNAWIWEKPGLIWQDAFGDHRTTAPTAKIAGHRAFGGPVDAGSTYLVGERGPELFTPDTGGGISTNASLRGLANSTGDVRQLGLTLAESIRFQTFTLAQALRDIVARLIGRNNRGFGNGLDGAGSGGSSGAGGGGGSSGGGGADGGGGGATPTAMSKLAQAGISETPIASGREAFGLGGRKLTGDGRFSINPGAFLPPAGEGGEYVPGKGGSRSWRNNNPGNIEYGRYARRMGAIGSDGRFAIFKNYNAGRHAQENLLFDSDSYRNLTLRQAIHRWAPASENNVPAYIAAMGADPNTRMSQFTPQQRIKLLDAMQRQEGWKPGVRVGGAAGGGKSTNVGAFGLGGFNVPAYVPQPYFGGQTPAQPGDIGSGGGARAVDLARSLRGGRAGAVARALNHYMHAGLWCADFVNGALAKVGVRGSMSAMAGSFLKWGKHVDNADIKKGDVLANNRHVGFANGSPQMHNGRMMIPMIAGNHGGKVGESWEPYGKYEARRAATPQAQVPPVIKEHHATMQARDAAHRASAALKAGAAGTQIGSIKIDVHGKQHHEEKKIAQAVHRRFNDAVATQLHDGAFA